MTSYLCSCVNVELSLLDTPILIGINKGEEEADSGPTSVWFISWTAIKDSSLSSIGSWLA